MTQQWRSKVLRLLVAFVIAEAVMVVLGSAAHSYFVQLAWSTAAGRAAGTSPAAIPFVDRITWAAHDLGGMVVPYAGTTSIALLSSFFAAAAVTLVTRLRAVVFGIAGALGIFALFTIMRLALGTVGVFGARGPVGLAAQMGVGLIAGVLFARMTRRSQP
jgi:hypothetical protein